MQDRNPVPQPQSRARRALRRAVTAVVAGVVLAGSGAWVWWMAGAASFEDPHSNRDLALARDTLGRELEHLDLRLHGLHARITGMRGLEAEARLLAGLDPFGGEAFDAESSYPAALPTECLGDCSTGRALIASALHIDRVLDQTHGLGRSYEDIYASLVDREEEWARIPSIYPVEGARLSSDFGVRRDPFTGKPVRHYGLDFSAPRGTPVYAAADGVVIRSGRYRGYGKLVEVDHGNGLTTRYAHNSRLSVRVGDRVVRGQVLSHVGSTGRASAPHLHYEVLVQGQAVDPEPYIFPGAILAE